MRRPSDIILMKGAASAAAVTPPPSANQQAYYQYQTGITLGTGVSQWDDQSGNNRHATQASTGFQPAYSGGILTFDGSDDYLNAGAFTFSQPVTIYLLMQLKGWTVSRAVFDGNTVNTGMLFCTGTSPNLALYAGSIGPATTAITIDGGFKAVACVINNTSSSIQVGSAGTPVTGTTGTNNMGGLRIGCKGNNSSFLNFELKEMILYNVAHDDATRASVLTYLESL